MFCLVPVAILDPNHQGTNRIFCFWLLFQGIWRAQIEYLEHSECTYACNESQFIEHGETTTTHNSIIQDTISHSTSILKAKSCLCIMIHFAHINVSQNTLRQSTWHTRSESKGIVCFIIYPVFNSMLLSTTHTFVKQRTQSNDQIIWVVSLWNQFLVNLVGFTVKNGWEKGKNEGL